MSRAKLILINGFAGAGKTTIARMYGDRHPMSMVIEGDELIVNIGKWSDNEEKARAAIFELTKAMCSTHLATGNDVVLPYLVTNVKHVWEFQSIASERGTAFYGVTLHSDRSDAIARLIKRGTWGEAGLPSITDKDQHVIEELVDKMEAALQQMPHARMINVKEGDSEDTYRQLMSYLSD